MSKRLSVILDGRGYALVPLSDFEEAARLHSQGITVRLESRTGDSTHIDRLEDLQSLFPQYVDLWGCVPSMFAIFNASRSSS